MATATREAYGKTLAKLIVEHDNLFVLDADLTKSTKTIEAKNARPEHHFNMGIAEGNMMAVAAGGSLWGSAPYMECLDYFRPADTDDPLGPNLNGYLPAPSYTNKNKQVSTAYLQNAAYIKLKNVQLGYTFPKGWIEKLGIDSLRLYTSIENLWTGSKIFDTIDPEMLNASANFYPLSTTYSFGLNVTF